MRRHNTCIAPFLRTLNALEAKLMKGEMDSGRYKDHIQLLCVPCIIAEKVGIQREFASFR